MTLVRTWSFAILLLLGCHCDVLAQSGSDAPDFQEVFQLIQEHAAGIDKSELQRAAVRGLVSELSPRVQWVTNQSVTVPESGLVNKTGAFEGNIGYIRISRVADGLARELAQVHQQFSATNRLKGIVLDLRFATGTDHAAAAQTADVFVSKAQSLVRLGAEEVTSRDKTNAIQLPVAILVNGSTTGAAETLAAVLRASGVGLVLGSRTAGQALVAQEFPLKDGTKLRITTGPVLLGDGTPIPSGGVKPDIDVVVAAEDERLYFADAFVLVPKTNQLAGVTGTNGNRRARFGEAELVREHRAGFNRESGEAPRVREPEPEPERPLVSDPALARALDLLKGLAVVRQSRS